MRRPTNGALRAGFVVVDGERYAGLARMSDLVREIAHMQADAARYANPLTLLPGEVPTANHAGRLLAAAVPFTACWCDLTGFREYNLQYGYDRGDQLIKLVARVLGAVARQDADFLGHAGGDRFMLLLQTDEWEARVREALELFAANAPGLFADADLARNAFCARDRRGAMHEVPLTALSIGVVPVAAGVKSSYIEVATAAAAARREAKKAGGNAMFVERRRLFET